MNCQNFTSPASNFAAVNITQYHPLGLAQLEHYL